MTLTDCEMCSGGSSSRIRFGINYRHGTPNNRTANPIRDLSGEFLGAGRELLGAIGSWGDRVEDKEVLRLLKEWNMDKAKRAAVEALAKESRLNPTIGLS